MSKTITIIQLLNKIANGEEVPKRIKYQCVIGKWNNKMLDYMYNDVEGIFDNFICTLCNNLNDEVEIIEEQEEQEEIDIQNIVMMDLEKYGFDIKDEFAIDLIFKVNELVQAVKQLDKKINK